MKRQELDNAVNAKMTEIRDILKTVYDALNQGQQKKILNNDNIRALFDLYGVEY